MSLLCEIRNRTVMATGASKDIIIEVEKLASGESSNDQLDDGEFSDIDYRSDDGQYLDTTDQCSSSQVSMHNLY